MKNLEKLRPVFFQLGIILALSATLLAFEWKSIERELPDLTGTRLDPLDQDVVITTHKKKEMKAPKPKPTVVFKEVKDDVDVSDIIKIDVEDDQNTEAEKWTPPLPEDFDEGREEDVFRVVESMPEFPGGYAALLNYLAEHIKYPVTARDAGIDGTVYLSFIVDKHGEVQNIEIERGIGGGCDEEALRVVKGMPAWKPGKQRGKAVNVAFTIPVKFVLKNQ